jgi:hypothetical protein
MIIALLIAGIGFLLAGLLGIAYGIPIKDFSFGNTVIIVGALAACTGMIMIALYAVVRELKAMAEHFESAGVLAPRTGFPAPLPAAGAAPRDSAPGHDGLLFDQQPGAADPVNGDPAVPPPWHEETTRERSRSEPPPVPAAEAAPAPKQRRNLLFSSTSRKERERAEGRAPDIAMTDQRTSPAVAPPLPPGKPSEPPPASFEDAWPQPERARSVDVRRSARTPPVPAEPNPAADRAAPPPPRREEPQAVTVLKSGVVDGMAYSLYSDGSIEAQMPEGMMRFTSIDELRAHLDQRP